MARKLPPESVKDFTSPFPGWNLKDLQTANGELEWMHKLSLQRDTAMTLSPELLEWLDVDSGSTTKF
jgi:hypothetical protein